MISRSISAAQFMATLSTAGREERKPVEEPTGRPATMEANCWENGEWVTRTLVWNERYGQYREFVNDTEAVNA